MGQLPLLSSLPPTIFFREISHTAYRMAQAPTLEHQDIAGEIYRQLANQLEGKP